MRVRSLAKLGSVAVIGRAGRALLYLAAFALVLQGLIAPTHFQEAGIGNGHLASFQHDADGTTHNKKNAPARRDSSDCPFCFASSIASAYVSPSPPILQLPRFGGVVSRRDERNVVVERFAVHWRSRAPPLV